jgi:hypothetical protein
VAAGFREKVESELSAAVKVNHTSQKQIHLAKLLLTITASIHQ